MEGQDGQKPPVKDDVANKLKAEEGSSGKGTDAPTLVIAESYTRDAQGRMVMAADIQGSPRNVPELINAEIYIADAPAVAQRNLEEEPNAQPHVNSSFVPIVLAEPLGPIGMVKLHECGNYQDLAAEINQILSEHTGIPRDPNPSMADPFPGFYLAYLSKLDEMSATAEGNAPPILDPAKQTWEDFSTLLLFITAASRED